MRLERRLKLVGYDDLKALNGLLIDLAKRKTDLQLQGIIRRYKFCTVVSEVLSFAGIPLFCRILR